MDAQLDVEIGGSADKELDEPRGGMLGEQAGGGHPHQSLASPGLAHLANGALLQPEHLTCSTGQPQSARSKGQAIAGPGEELVLELLAQVANVQ